MSAKRGAGVLILASLLAPGFALAGGPAYRLRSDQGPSPVHAPSDARLLTAVGDRLFFVGTDSSNGTEVWTSDGSAAGTHLVRDIYPGPDIVIPGGVGESDPRANPTPGPLASLNGILLFAASDGTSPCVLWRSDGSSAGTYPVVDPGRADVPVLPCMALGFRDFVPPIMPVSGGRAFFGANQGNSGPFGLWSTDGTEAGTHYLAPLPPYNPFKQFQATDVSGILAFQNSDSIYGYGLWRSDGTPEGTRFVTSLGGPVGKLAAIGHSVVVEVDPSGASTLQIWLVDLESAASTLLRTISWSTTYQQLASGLTGIASLRSGIVFSVATGAGDDGVWRSDGTPAGTTRLSPYPVGNLAAAGDVVVGANSTGLFRTDGTVDGTFQIRDMSPPSDLRSVGNKVWFTTHVGPSSFEAIWTTDGTTAGTSIVSYATAGYGFVAVGSRVFFSSLTHDGNTRGRVWSSDGTAAGTGPLLPLTANSIAFPGVFKLIAATNQGAFFGHSALPPASFLTPLGDADLWFSDGRPGGAIHLGSIAYGNGGGVALLMGAAVLDGKLIFMTEGSDTELWQSDGTRAGTIRLTTQPPLSGVVALTFTDLARAGHALVLIEKGFLGEFRIWRTDGSPGGTTAAMLSISGAYPDRRLPLSRVGNRLVFPLVTTGSALQLFSTDGTPANTVAFATVASYFSPVTSGSTLFFVGSGSTSSTKALWKTDGTGPGTSPLVDLTSIDSLVAGPNGLVYFVAPGGDGGSRLWRSDGTTVGTFSLVEVPTGAQLFPTSSPAVFFTAGETSTGRELWRTDGTQQGTRLVRDILPGGLGSNPTSVVSVGHVVLFAATDGESGYELWRSDGTESGTRLVEDLTPGPGSSSPAQFLLGCNLVYFTADADGIGREPWAVPLSAIDPAARGAGCGPLVQGPGMAPVRRPTH